MLSTTTVVVPTPQGFINIYESSGEQNLAGANTKKHGLLCSRDLSLDKRALSNLYKYPSAVKCQRGSPDICVQANLNTGVKSVRTRYIKKIIFVKPTVTKIVPGQTSTVQATVIRNSTSSVVPPGVSSTITFSTTSISTTTVLTTFISTTTST